MLGQVRAETGDEGTSSAQDSKGASYAAPTVLADGTYASQSLATESTGEGGGAGGDGKEGPVGLRQLLLTPDYFLASTLAACLTKLVCRYSLKAGK